MTNKLIINQQAAENSWTTVDAEAELPGSDTDIIVPLARWQAEGDSLKSRNGKVGIQLGSEDGIDDIIGALPDLPLIAIEFPAFPDGRGYSYARLLRERYGYEGEIRAVGDVLQDQVLNYHRCGFNAMLLRDDQNLEEALRRFNDFSVKYQTGTDETQPIYRRRNAA